MQEVMELDDDLDHRRGGKPGIDPAGRQGALAVDHQGEGDDRQHHREDEADDIAFEAGVADARDLDCLGLHYITPSR